MIDWLTMTVPLTHHPIQSGRVISINPDGSIDWETPKRTTIRGSYESAIQIRSQGHLDKEGRATELYIDGNPSKFLQGHNVFGSCDIQHLVCSLIRVLTDTLEISISDIHPLNTITLHRIDYTHSLKFESRALARLYVQSMANKATSRTGRPVLNGHTLYFGKNSRRWSLKLYTKGDDLDYRKHRLPDTLPKRDDVYKEADSLVRVELTLRSLELKKLKMRTLNYWNETTLNTVYLDYLGKLKMATKLSISADEIKLLNRCYRDTYFLWRSGIQPQHMMSTPTFYRHRSVLLRHGIDIAIPKPPKHTAEIIPLVKTIEATLYHPPAWAYDAGLIHAA